MGGPDVSGTPFLTFESLQSGRQEAACGLPSGVQWRLTEPVALEPWWCGLARRHGGGAPPASLIGQHLLSPIESWSGQGCELFNAYLGSVPWHECPRGCGHSLREDLYLVPVTFSGTLPPPEYVRDAALVPKLAVWGRPSLCFAFLRLKCL